MRRRDPSRTMWGLALGLGAATAALVALRPARFRRDRSRSSEGEAHHEPEFFMPTTVSLRVGLTVLGTLIVLVAIGMIAAGFVMRAFDLQDPITKPEIGFSGSHVFARQPEQRRDAEARWARDLGAGEGIEGAMAEVIARGERAFAPPAEEPTTRPTGTESRP